MKRTHWTYRCIALVVSCLFTVTSINPVYAQMQPTQAIAPKPLPLNVLSQPYEPILIKGLKVNQTNPFEMEFIVSDPWSVVRGQRNTDHRPQSTDHLEQESTQLIKYFLAALTTPEQDMWVNLSPYEKNRIIPESFGRTEMGRELLVQDYLLKQVTASLLHPDGEYGQEFWSKIATQTSEDIPLELFNKVWIMPDKAVVYENEGIAYVVEASLKVMLEEDYLAQQKSGPWSVVSDLSKNTTTDHRTQTTQIIRETIIPAIETEVNNSKNFAKLRQIYHSLILATWYKKKMQNAILTQVYADQNKTNGVSHNDPKAAEKIWQEYTKTFKEGAYNFIKEEYDPQTQQIVPRKYFSGGMAMEVVLSEPAALTSQQQETIPDNAYLVRVALNELTPDSDSAAMVKKKSADDFKYNVNIRTPKLQDQLPGLAKKREQTKKALIGYFNQMIHHNPFEMPKFNVNYNRIMHLLRHMIGFDAIGFSFSEQDPDGFITKAAVSNVLIPLIEQTKFPLSVDRMTQFVLEANLDNERQFKYIEALNDFKVFATSYSEGAENAALTAPAPDPAVMTQEEQLSIDPASLAELALAMTEKDVQDIAEVARLIKQNSDHYAKILLKEYNQTKDQFKNREEIIKIDAVVDDPTIQKLIKIFKRISRKTGKENSRNVSRSLMGLIYFYKYITYLYKPKYQMDVISDISLNILLGDIIRESNTKRGLKSSTIPIEDQMRNVVLDFADNLGNLVGRINALPKANTTEFAQVWASMINEDNFTRADLYQNIKSFGRVLEARRGRFLTFLRADRSLTREAKETLILKALAMNQEGKDPKAIVDELMQVWIPQFKRSEAIYGVLRMTGWESEIHRYQWGEYAKYAPFPVREITNVYRDIVGMHLDPHISSHDWTEYVGRPALSWFVQWKKIEAMTQLSFIPLEDPDGNLIYNDLQVNGVIPEEILKLVYKDVHPLATISGTEDKKWRTERWQLYKGHYYPPLESEWIEFVKMLLYSSQNRLKSRRGNHDAVIVKHAYNLKIGNLRYDLYQSNNLWRLQYPYGDISDLPFSDYGKSLQTAQVLHGLMMHHLVVKYGLINNAPAEHHDFIMRLSDMWQSFENDLEETLQNRGYTRENLRLHVLSNAHGVDGIKYLRELFINRIFRLREKKVTEEIRNLVESTLTEVDDVLTEEYEKRKDVENAALIKQRPALSVERIADSDINLTAKRHPLDTKTDPAAMVKQNLANIDQNIYEDIVDHLLWHKPNVIVKDHYRDILARFIHDNRKKEKKFWSREGKKIFSKEQVRTLLESWPGNNMQYKAHVNSSGNREISIILHQKIKPTFTIDLTFKRDGQVKLGKQFKSHQNYIVDRLEESYGIDRIEARVIAQIARRYWFKSVFIPMLREMEIDHLHGKKIDEKSTFFAEMGFKDGVLSVDPAAMAEQEQESKKDQSAPVSFNVGDELRRIYHNTTRPKIFKVEKWPGQAIQLRMEEDPLPRDKPPNSITDEDLTYRIYASVTHGKSAFYYPVAMRSGIFYKNDIVDLTKGWQITYNYPAVYKLIQNYRDKNGYASYLEAIDHLLENDEETRKYEKHLINQIISLFPILQIFYGFSSDEQVDEYFNQAPQQLENKGIASALLEYLGSYLPVGTKVKIIGANRPTVEALNKGTVFEDTLLGKMYTRIGFKVLSIEQKDGQNPIVVFQKTKNVKPRAKWKDVTKLGGHVLSVESGVVSDSEGVENAALSKVVPDSAVMVGLKTDPIELSMVEENYIRLLIENNYQKQTFQVMINDIKDPDRIHQLMTEVLKRKGYYRPEINNFNDRSRFPLEVPGDRGLILTSMGDGNEDILRFTVESNNVIMWKRPKIGGSKLGVAPVAYVWWATHPEIRKELSGKPMKGYKADYRQGRALEKAWIFKIALPDGAKDWNKYDYSGSFPVWQKDLKQNVENAALTEPAPDPAAMAKQEFERTDSAVVADQEGQYIIPGFDIIKYSVDSYDQENREARESREARYELNDWQEGVVLAQIENIIMQAQEIGDIDMENYLIYVLEQGVKKFIKSDTSEYIQAVGKTKMDGREVVSIAEELLNQSRSDDDVKLLVKLVLIHEFNHILDHKLNRLSLNIMKLVDINLIERSALIRSAAYFDGFIKKEGDGLNDFIVMYRFDGDKIMAYTSTNSEISSVKSDYQKPPVIMPGENRYTYYDQLARKGNIVTSEETGSIYYYESYRKGGDDTTLEKNGVVSEKNGVVSDSEGVENATLAKGASDNAAMADNSDSDEVFIEQDNYTFKYRRPTQIAMASVTVMNPKGVHGGPSQYITGLVKSYQDIWPLTIKMKFKGEYIDTNDVKNIMELKIKQGDVLEIEMFGSEEGALKFVQSMAARVADSETRKKYEAKITRQPLNEDDAALTKGGIDFDASKMDLEIRTEQSQMLDARPPRRFAAEAAGRGCSMLEDEELRKECLTNTSSGIQFKFTPQQIEGMRQNITGFNPVIINIQPIVNLPLFLGLNDIEDAPDETETVEADGQDLLARMEEYSYN